MNSKAKTNTLAVQPSETVSLNVNRTQTIELNSNETVQTDQPHTSNVSLQPSRIAGEKSIHANRKGYEDNTQIDIPKYKANNGRFKNTATFLVLLLNIVAKTSSVLDTVTDISLLYKASTNNAIDFTMILFVSLLSPYVLSYSSGIELFLYRGTFDNIELFTFKSLLLGFYLLPTGIIYFILIDAIDVLLAVYICFAYVIMCKRDKKELIRIESDAAETFGMSRINWISFKKQKTIAQLFFETFPQLILQILLITSVISGIELAGITNNDLILSISSAVINFVIQMFKLYSEAIAVEETLVGYTLQSVTARFSWVPFLHKIDHFFKTQQHADDSQDVTIDYNITYKYPLITSLSNGAVKATVEYNFSSITIKQLIASIKAQKYQSVNVRPDFYGDGDDKHGDNDDCDAKLIIKFGQSLQLTSVRDIITLMQVCREKEIELVDIANEDVWKRGFQNISDDPRLFSHTFDDNQQPLLISMYKTRYDNVYFDILKAFIQVYDVPLDVQDANGNTIIHHMIKENDYNAVETVFSSLKPNQKIHLSVFNNSGESIMYLALQHDYNVLNRMNREIKEERKYDVEVDDLYQEYRQKMLHRLLLMHDAQINAKIFEVRRGARTALGYVLMDFINFVEYFDIINFLLDHDAKFLFANEIISLCEKFSDVAEKDNAILYFNLFNKITEKCGILPQTIVNENNENPIHLASMDSNINALKILCEKYPSWLYMTDKDDNLPLIVAIQNNNVDGMICLYDMMKTQKRRDIINITAQKKFIQNMITMGSNLLENKRVQDLQKIFERFNYFQIFYWQSQTNKLNAKSTVISLIKHVSKQEHSDTINDILFNPDLHLLKQENHESEIQKEEKEIKINDDNNDEMKDTQQDQNEEQKYNIPNDNQQISMQPTTETEANVEQKENSEDIVIIPEISNESFSKEPISWIEVAYSSMVETFSALDLYTDIIVLFQLYASNNIWWTSWMLILMCCPYLVSYGPLATLIQQSNINFREKRCVAFLVVLLITPFSVVYLVLIDVVFMIYSLMSIIVFLITFSKVDIRDKIDVYIFQKLFNMNRTEITGYRRLRTLSQLFFETIPQIFLQLRILWIVKWSNNPDAENFEITEETLAISIVLALVHMLLEAGIIFLDSLALKMPFMQYALVCLGARVQWIPFQHMLSDFIKNQVYIYYDQEQKTKFDAESCDIYCNEMQRAEKVLFDFESICYFQYPVKYQFSKKSIKKLSQKLINSAPIMIPPDFNLSTSNMLIQNLMQHVLCKSQIKIGYESCGNIDMYALCELYQGSINKIKVNINCISKKTVTKILNNTENGVLSDGIIEKIYEDLIYFGEISAISWIPQDRKLELSDSILNTCLLGLNDDTFFSRMDVLRNCFINDFYIGSECKTMKRILKIITRYHDKYEQDVSWCFAIIFILLYTRGNIFMGECINGCCKVDNSTKKIIEKYLPSYVVMGNCKMPFKLFECCKAFKNDMEEVLLSNCKNYLLFNKTIDEKFFEKAFLNKNNDHYNDLNPLHINLLAGVINQEKNIESKDDVTTLDDLVTKLKLHTHFDTYLTDTMKFRILNEHETTIETTIESKMQHEVEISFDKLFPQNINDEKSQLGDLKFTFNGISVIDEQKKNTEENIMVKCKIYLASAEKIYFYNTYIEYSEDDLALEIHVKMNSGIAACNYLILHQDNKLSSYPPIVLEWDSVELEFDSITINSQYFHFKEIGELTDKQMTVQVQQQESNAIVTSKPKLKPVMTRLRTIFITDALNETFKDNYTILKQLGKPGQFGKAYRCKRKKDGMILAVKEISKARIYRLHPSDNIRQSLLKSMQAEIDVMRRLKHKYICKLYETFETKHTLHIVMEECKGGELFDRIKAKRRYPEQDAKSIIKQVCEALHYMHEYHRVVHCDLKPDNILFVSDDEKSDIKIIDFGMSKVLPRLRSLRE
eukprot:298477_1